MSTGNFTVYRSSAGSGKTFTLVKEYLRIAIADPRRFRNILAITFTNKAAAEMKNRVLKYLKALVAPPSQGDNTAHEILLPELIKETGLTEQEIILRAGEVLSLILHQYSDFAITTIDALMHKVVRTFTFDLKLSSGFEIELDQKKLLMEAVNKLISMAGADPGLTGTLVEFVKQQTENEKNFHIETEIFRLSKDTFELEGTAEQLEKLQQLEVKDLLEVNRKLNEKKRAFENSLKIPAQKAYAIMKQNNIDPASFFHGKSGIGVYFKNIAEGRFDKIQPNTRVLATVSDDKWTSKGCSQTTLDLIDQHKETWVQLFNEMQQVIAESYNTYILHGLYTRYFYPLILLNEVHKILNELKHTGNVLLISDFNHLISRVVETESVPFIYERLGVRYKHFMIDEFQDTSILQWHNLIPLLENMLADGNYCMLVGDGKQAIYRWRNGEVEQFVQLPTIYKKPETNEYQAREQALIRNYQEEYLSMNYRSSEVIVQFNNELYEFLANNLDASTRNIYLQHQQTHSPRHSGGYVQLEFADYIDEDTDVPERIAGLIANILEDGYSLQDIGILCRSNYQATNIAAFLLGRGIKVISAESLLLDGNPAVGFLTATLRYLQDAEDKVSRAAMVRYLHYSGKLKDPELHASLAHANQSIELFRNLLRENGFELSPMKLLKMPVYDMFEEIIRIFSMNEIPDPYIQFFLDVVREYNTKSGSEGSGFIDFWEEKKAGATITVPAGVEAVNVVTIHKSKGLEFPVVILPGKDTISKNTLGLVWAEVNDPDLPELPSVLLSNSKALIDTPFEDLYTTESQKTRLDFTNLLYVSTTRAARQLYLLLAKPSTDPSNMKSVQDVIASWLKHKELWQDGVAVYPFGERKKNKHAVISDNGDIASEPMISEPWQNRVILSLQYPGTTKDPETLEKIAWGNLLHQALSGYNGQRSPAQIAEELLRSGILHETQTQKLIDTLLKLIAHAEIGALLNEPGTLYSEAEILTAEGRSYRPDRVTISEKGVTLIDYKTGEPTESHKDQINHYGVLLTEMGYANIKKALIYIGNEVNVEYV